MNQSQVPNTDLSQVTTVTQLYPPKWLRAEHLNGQTYLVEITQSTLEMLYNRRERQYQPKIVLNLQTVPVGDEEAQPLPYRMPLNQTQAKALTDIAGRDAFRTWIGIAMIIKPGKTQSKQDTILIQPAIT